MDANEKYWFLMSNSNECKIINDTLDNGNNRMLYKWTSRSPYYETREALIEAEGILDEPCKECGCPVSTNWIEPTNTRVIESNTCFHCLIWLEKLDIKDDPRTVRIHGTHYHISNDDPNAYFKGHGGAEFNIRFNDGRLVTTHNLWHQGDIPERFKARLPDNATFVEVRHTERDKILNHLFPNL